MTAALLAALLAQSAAPAPSVFFSKSFPGSVPAYFEVILQSSGQAVYKEAPDDEQPLRFTLSAADTKTIFALAEKLEFFKRPLESKLKVANMGMKTLRFEGGAARGEARFNYSEDPDARAIADWFEKISETELHLVGLERTARFDRLGLNKALLHFETSWDRGRIVAPEQFLPILDKITKNKSYLHMAQARAASLAERIRALAQSPPEAAPPAPAKPDPQGEGRSKNDEQQLLEDAMSQAGDSPVEFIRTVERHLRLHPASTLRPELERAILKAAVDAGDHARVRTYGERALARDSDPVLVEHFARALLEAGDLDSARRALSYAERLPKTPALVLQSRAREILGEADQALALAAQAYEAAPTAESAAQLARSESRAGRASDAIRHYAEALALPDPKLTPDRRRQHRRALGELYTKVHGSEAGLGDLLLNTYDRLAGSQPAAQQSAPLDAFEFRLSGLRGDSLRLADFLGKVQVLDFWATWCTPCRYVHPLLVRLEQKYSAAGDVVFHSINTDRDRSLVEPFVRELSWSDAVYFDESLTSFYRIVNIPTTMVFNKRAELVARLAGYTPDGFEQLLAEKIDQARRE